MTVRLDLLGTRVDVDSSDPEVRSLVETLWSPFTTTSDAPPVRVFGIAATAGDAWVLSGLPVETRHRELWNLMDALRHVVLDAVTTGVPGVVPLHAACVSRDGTALLLPGPSGAGKTTLTLALLERGWAYLTDDLAPVEVTTGLVRPFPKPLGVKDRSSWDRVVRRCSALTGVRPPEGTFLVPPTCFRVAEEPQPATHVVFPAFDPDAPEAVVPLSTAEAVVTASAFLRDVDASLVSWLRQLCTGWRSYRLAYATADRGASLIEDVLAGRV